MTTNQVIDSKEIEVYKHDIAKAQQYSNSLEIKTDDDYKLAMSEGIEIKKIIETITNRKEEITKPLNLALKSVRELFKPLEVSGEQALAIIKTKMLTFSQVKAEKAEADKQKIAERVERGTMKPETAVRKIDEIQAPEKTVQTDDGKATTRMVTKYRVVDKTKIPLEFMEPNMVAIKASFKEGKPVDGIEVYQEAELSLGK